MPLLEGWGIVLHSIFHTSEQYPLDLNLTLRQSLLSKNWLLNHFTQMVTSLGNKIRTQEGMA